MTLSKKDKTYIIFIIVSQIIAILVWFFLEKNYFIGMLIASLLAVKFGFKREKE